MSFLLGFSGKLGLIFVHTEAALLLCSFLLRLLIVLIWMLFSWIFLSFMAWGSNSFLCQGPMCRLIAFCLSVEVNQSM
nr:hypothetical protein Iba_chr11aCG5650 [Ipomoea batatas]